MMAARVVLLQALAAQRLVSQLLIGGMIELLEEPVRRGRREVGARQALASGEVAIVARACVHCDERLSL